MNKSGTPTRAASKSRSWVKVEGGPVLACIDMGTNSFHMIVCRASPKRDHFDVITRVREAVPFFRQALTAHYIDESALRSAVRILKDMRRQAEGKGATTVLAVATSAVRESKNGQQVLDRIRKDLAIDARMISGQEEARLIYLGVLWAMSELSGHFAIVDIGGGSTEIIVADRDHSLFSESYKLGAARLTQRFFRKGQPTPQSIRELHDEVTGMLRPAAATVAARGGFQRLIGTSGTIQALAKLDRIQCNQMQSPLQGWKIQLNHLSEIVSELEMSTLKGRKISGISSDRSQTILAGSVVLLETMRSLGANQVEVCTAALREGVVVDRFLQTGWLNVGLQRHKDPRSDSVHALLDKYRANVQHAEQVAWLAEEIYRQSNGILHCYVQSAGHLLWSAAMLHDVGMFIGRNGHHKHSHYLIRHGGLLGHSEEEVELIACIARYHRGSEPKESHEMYQVLKPADCKLVADLSAILRVAEALDRSHRQVIEGLTLTVEGGNKSKQNIRKLTLHLQLREGATCQPEAWALAEKKACFEKQFGVKVVLLVGNKEMTGQPMLVPT